MGSDKWLFSRLTHYTDIRTLLRHGIYDVKGICICIDARNDLLPGPYPARGRIPYVRYVLMRAIAVRLSNASYYNVCHGKPLRVIGFS